jgi:pimeloyl-ACP methyl ester carboxylesterase
MASTVEVDGAELWYEVRGSGPLLLMIPGGNADSELFGGVAPLLAEDYRVLTYDPRGLSRSTVEDRTADITVETQAEDVHRLLAAVTSEPAYIFGTSGGAHTGLALAARHPEQIRTLVAHEPPLTYLLLDEAAQQEFITIIHDAYSAGGPLAAMGAFADYAFKDAAGEFPEPTDQMVENMDLFFGRMFREILDFRPDLEALRAVDIVTAGGVASASQLAHQAARILADLLDRPFVEFPGGHVDFAEPPLHFVEALHKVLPPV